ncbi:MULTISPECIES: protein kinase family protein [unclassified Streptomyces]|uniref:protein kinase family protein n=1 Tax=unclassified Streptomyces TaxID=2593676 RepID=UPI00236606FE|nr:MULTISPECIES: protein kinase family protein [unclassified Streptomyces]MDF3145643.1 protein kinase family protein [Streptomyces sp. T21Q-yed]WDF35962.1 protein kinase family protein [Streptomyces sp. T12]
MTRTERLTAHTDIATSLALLSDHELAELVESGTPLGTGIGGRSTLIEVDGRRVFVKRAPLTDVELRPQNIRSTANLLGLPAYFHYGIGSPGFGAWRELAVHTMTTNWVVSDRFSGFPLTHHWRILPQPPQPLPDELADVERAVAYWGGDPRVRERIEGLRTASASLALFLEFVPHTLHDWLDAQLRTDDADAACAFVERELTAVTDFLHEVRLLHFDAHFQNILTDGRRLYLADYGLALSARFPLTPQEREFFDRHRLYDRVYTATRLVNWLATALYGYGLQEREAFVRACADGMRPEGIPRAAADIIKRYAPLAAVMGDFARRLQNESRLAPFPHDELRRAQEGAGMPASR